MLFMMKVLPSLLISKLLLFPPPSDEFEDLPLLDFEDEFLFVPMKPHLEMTDGILGRLDEFA